MPKRKADPHVSKNSKHLVSAVATDLNCSIGEADLIVSALAQALTAAIKRDEYVHLDGVGTFKPFHMKEHLRFIPASPIHKHEDAVWMEGVRCIHFTPSKTFIKRLNKDYKGLDTLKELYDLGTSRPSKAYS